MCFSIIARPLELGAIFEISVVNSLLLVANFVLLPHKHEELYYEVVRITKGFWLFSLLIRN